MARGHFRGQATANKAWANATRERLIAAQEELARSRVRERERGTQGEIGFLVGRLSAHGKEIGQIKEQLAALPRVIVADRPPGPNDDVGPKGTVWLITGEPIESASDKPYIPIHRRIICNGYAAIERPNVRVYIPIGSMIVVSVILSLAMALDRTAA